MLHTNTHTQEQNTSNNNHTIFYGCASVCELLIPAASTTTNNSSNSSSNRNNNVSVNSVIQHLGDVSLFVEFSDHKNDPYDSTLMIHSGSHCHGMTLRPVIKSIIAVTNC